MMYIVGYMQGDFDIFRIPVFVTEDKEKAEAWKQKFDSILNKLQKILYTENELGYSWGSPRLEKEEVAMWKMIWQEKISDIVGAYIEEVEKR